MVQCQNCGNINNHGSNFCRFCGTRIVFGQAQPPPPEQFQQPQQNQSYEYNPPKPYSWKTDEFQAQDTRAARRTQEINRVQQLPNYNANQPQNLVYQQPHGVAHGYRCPRCGSQSMPVTTRKISTAGWIVFAVLLIFTFFFFWIGLLMKEDVRVCPVCGFQVS
jgi:RNA polymerase subunit RPABC4/transcription elongation factor Spt4